MENEFESGYNRDVCRASADAWHVDYLINENEEDGEGVFEKRNLSHLEVVNSDDFNDNEVECFWVVSEEGEHAELIIGLDDEGGDYILHQKRSLQTCEQLSDMFRQAAETLRRKLAMRVAENTRIQTIIDSQNLPFE
jgi:hypothetical protein